MLEAFGRALRGMIRRGAITQATLNPTRVLLQVTLRNGETRQGVELWAPYGRSSFPPQGEVVVVQIGRASDHLIALGGDDPTLRIPDLEETEFGDRDARAQQIVFRHDRIEITTSLKLVVNTTGDTDITAGGNVNIAASGSVNVTSAVAVNVTAPAINLGSSGENLFSVLLSTVWAWLSTHVHSSSGGTGNGGPPVGVPAEATVTTSVVKAG
jgi:phage baseplate assembly protein V